MNKLVLSSGLPRSGSTLLQNILNSNPEFHATPTSGILESLLNIRTTFSHNTSYKAQNRLELLDDMGASMKGFLEGYYNSKDGVVFDKSRGWPNKLDLIDTILGHKETKVIWIYRNPVELVNSMEKHHNKTILLEGSGESNNQYATLDSRIGSYYSLIDGPLTNLRDAIEQGYGDRILFLDYNTLTSNPNLVMESLHTLIDEPKYDYPIYDMKQSTNEFDGIYNYKFPHTIKEGAIEKIKSESTLHPKYVHLITTKYSKFIEFMETHDQNLIVQL